MALRHGWISHMAKGMSSISDIALGLPTPAKPFASLACEPFGPTSQEFPLRNPYTNTTSPETSFFLSPSFSPMPFIPMLATSSFSPTCGPTTSKTSKSNSTPQRNPTPSKPLTHKATSPITLSPITMNRSPSPFPNFPASSPAGMTSVKFWSFATNLLPRTLVYKTSANKPSPNSSPKIPKPWPSLHGVLVSSPNGNLPTNSPIYSSTQTGEFAGPPPKV